MKRSRSLIASLTVLVSVHLPLGAQEPAPPLPGTRIILRVSTEFVQRLMGTGFARDEPVDLTVGDAAVAGVAHV